jgi:hypothetical protein
MMEEGSDGILEKWNHEIKYRWKDFVRVTGFNIIPAFHRSNIPVFKRNS